MTSSELLVKQTQENQIREILMLIEHGVKNGKSMEEIIEDIKALLKR